MQNHTSLKFSPTDKLKHELLGSLGVIGMLSESMIKCSDSTKKNRFAKIIHTLAKRNMQLIASFETNDTSS